MKGVLIQYATSFFLALLCAMNALCSAWPSYTIEILRSENSPLGFPISSTTANLIGSIPMLGSLLATVAAGYVGKVIGRKKAMLLSGIMYAVGWSLIVSARYTFQIIAARFIIGLSSGLVSVIAIVYISEITQITVRGSTATMSGLLYSCGIMVSYIEGWFGSYEVICYINLSFVVVHVIIMYFLHESPTYLLMTGNETAALKSLKFYRGESKSTAAILEELAYLKEQIQGDGANDTDAETAEFTEKEKLQDVESNTKTKENPKQKNGIVLLFTVPHNRRAIITSVIFMSLGCSMGLVAVQTYASEFFTYAAPTLSADVCSVIFALTVVFSNIMSAVVANFVPRRALIISTCFISSVSLASLGAALHFPETPSWVALLAMTVFVIVHSLGVVSTVYVQLSESYGPQVKSTAAAVVTCTLFLFHFLVLLFFPPAVDTIGLDGTFFVFSGIAALTTVLAYFMIKETRLVPLEEIQKMYDSGFMYKKIKQIES